MIPYNTITAWGVTHPWVTREQVEQDLLLSKAIIDIYTNETLSGDLIFRGGTALHKLIMPEPFRYSEDLDFVRTSAGGIGNILDTLRVIGEQSGYTVKTQLAQYPKQFWHCKAQTNINLKIKIEINTYERTPALQLCEIPHAINTEWFMGNAKVRMFQNEEMAATKLRALYQRTKGRDLLDLWLLTNVVGINSELVCHAFETYRPEGFTAKKAILNLEKKLGDNLFLTDIDNLITGSLGEYDVYLAAKQIIDLYLANL